MFDSVHSTLDHASAMLIKDFFRCGFSNIKVVAVQKQQAGSNDCGVHAIAAVEIGQDPSLLKYHQAVMRHHLIECFNAKKIELFPTV